MRPRVGKAAAAATPASRSQLTLGGGITAQLTDTLAFEAAYHVTPPTGNVLSQTISLGLDYRF
jgi:opacity protein-like surface antigen